MALKKHRRVYRILLAATPSDIRGIEARYFNELLYIMRWVDRELVIVTYKELNPAGLVICFYVFSGSEDGARIFEKVEAQIEKFEFLKSSSY